eukprot:05105.XXX_286482_286009_1 [CDS] Oithona nana genome sequencing.
MMIRSQHLITGHTGHTVLVAECTDQFAVTMVELTTTSVLQNVTELELLAKDVAHANMSVIVLGSTDQFVVPMIERTATSVLQNVLELMFSAEELVPVGGNIDLNHFILDQVKHALKLFY